MATSHTIQHALNRQRAQWALYCLLQNDTDEARAHLYKITPASFLQDTVTGAQLLAKLAREVYDQVSVQ